MIGHEIDAVTGGDLVRFVRALGQHRYVAGRLHLIHAFAVEAACAAGDPAAPDPALAEARAWCESVLAIPDLDLASKDERLHRRATDAELVAVLSAFWSTGEQRDRSSIALALRLAQIGLPQTASVRGMGGPHELDAERLPFDEGAEEDVFPLLVDAGWELLSLRALDPERHRGAMNAFGEALAFEVAKFEEENAVPETITLHELPALGPIELLTATDAEGALRAPFVLWTSGDETYVDYVLRGVLKVAKLPAP